MTASPFAISTGRGIPDLVAGAGPDDGPHVRAFDGRTIGSQYRAATLFHDETQRRLAEESKQAVAQRLRQPVVTQVVPAATFYVAEEYHQDF